MGRVKHTRIVAVAASCQVCDWADTDTGALGRAAQHHDRTGHLTETVQTLHVRYGEQPTPEELGQLTIEGNA